ncbi:unnamed protein product [Durusdinium trenchii]|uniref:Uncharacterized protein n=1 Tax=Durusdinium trenchii TaxID=1381693 RepID=A0ABP0HNG9_9DINO
MAMLDIAGQPWHLAVQAEEILCNIHWIGDWNKFCTDGFPTAACDAEDGKVDDGDRDAVWQPAIASPAASEPQPHVKQLYQFAAKLCRIVPGLPMNGRSGPSNNRVTSTPTTKLQHQALQCQACIHAKVKPQPVKASLHLQALQPSSPQAAWQCELGAPARAVGSKQSSQLHTRQPSGQNEGPGSECLDQVDQVPVVTCTDRKSHECPAPLTQQQRRAASQRRQAEQEKLRRYAEGLPAETVEDAKDGDPRGRSSASAPPNRARPPLLPSLERRKPEESRERDTGAQANREGGSRGSRRGSRGRSSISPSPSVVSLPDIETGLVAGSAQVAVVGLAPAGPASPTLEVLPALEAELPEAVEELASPSVAMQEPGASCDMFHSDQVAEKADASLAASIGSMNSVSGYVQLDEPDVHVRIQCSDDEFAVEIRTD